MAVGAETHGAVRTVAQVDELVSLGELRCAPQTMSGWHHHGNHTTCAYVRGGSLRLEWGASSNESAELLDGDFYVIPPNTIHREGNPGSEEQVIVGCYVGSGTNVVNVEGPGAAGAVSVFRGAEIPIVADTDGMIRQMTDPAEPVMVGVVRCTPGTVSDWHHHGGRTTCVYLMQGQVHVEWGPGGKDSADLSSGDFYVQSPEAIHRETNTGSEEQVLVGFALGTGPRALHVEGAEPRGNTVVGTGT